MFSTGNSRLDKYKITVPFDFKFWINEKFTDVYKKKTDIVQLLILEFVKIIKTDYVSLDGAFASDGMIKFFQKNLIHFCMRIPRNRVVISQKGVEAQLQKHPELRLMGYLPKLRYYLQLLGIRYHDAMFCDHSGLHILLL